MSRRFCLTLAAFVSLAGLNLAYGQDTSAGNPADSSASASPNIAKLQSENNLLKKEVSDAAKTIADLQTQLSQNQGKLTDTQTQLTQSQAQLTQTQGQLTQTQAQLAQTKTQLTQAQALLGNTSSGSVTAAPAAPATPPKALPLDATNVVTTPTGPGAPPADAAAAGGRTYTVVKGDSLWKIAHKMYPGDTKNGVDKIQEANKDAIGGKPLKIGQILIIPQ